MESLCFVVLGYLLIGEVTHQQYVLQHVQPFFFAEECFRYIFDAAHALMEEQRTIDILSVRDALITDIDNAALAARIKAFKEYFVCCGDLPKHCSDEDVKKHYDATIELTTTYTISVYATKAGFDDSDVATATLCYIEAEPSTGSVATDVINIPSRAVLIQNNGGVLSISGLDAGTVVNVYNTSGTMVGSATASDGVTNISTSLSKGDIAIVKIGGKSIKVLMQ